MKVALVHDWLTGMRGGEKCLEVFAELFPEAPLFTLLHVPGSVSEVIEKREIRTSWLQNIKNIDKKYRYFLPLLPNAMQSFDTSEFDLLISSSHCVAKMIPRQGSTRHWCYLFTPMRYVWDLYDDYFGQASLPVKLAARLMAPRLKRLDVETSTGVDHFVSISNFIAERTRRCLHQESEVIYPPVSLERFAPADEVQDWDLVVSAFAPYKRIDLAIEASNRLQRPLKIIGDGQVATSLKQRAGAQVEFLGWLTDEEIAWHMARCRSFIFPGVEDFGITPVEAQAAGRPVVAHGKGGALETVRGLDDPLPSGVFFAEQTIDSLCEALQKVDQHNFDGATLSQRVQRFSRERFKSEVIQSINTFLGEKLLS